MGASFNSVDVPVKFHSPKCSGKFRNSENLSNQTTKSAGITTVRMTMSVFMAMKSHRIEHEGLCIAQNARIL
jgi:hypothetical protein